MKKKKYCSPEIELTLFQLASNILLSSIEVKPTQDGGSEPDEDDILDGGLW